MKMLAKYINRIFGIDKKADRARRQGGYVVISLAAIGLFGGAAAAVPVLNRVVGSLNASDTSPVAQSGAACAAEHALWRIENDPTLWTGMTGTPPTTSYQHPACGVLTDADIDVTALDNPPTGDDRFEVALEVSPKELPTNTDVQFTYTLTITNDDIVPHDITRVIIDPKWFFAPDTVSGSTAGITTDDPVRIGGSFFGLQYAKFQWDLATYVTVPPFGGEVQLIFTASDNRGAGSNFNGASVRFDGVGEIFAPNSARVRFQNDSDLLIEQFVSPGVASAGGNTTFDYTIRATNTGSSDITLEWVRGWHDQTFSYVFGSSNLDTGSGPTSFADPSVTSSGWLFDWFSEYVTLDSRARYRWNVPPTTINPGSSVDLTYQMQASLEPGTYFSRASGLTAEQPGGIWALLELSTSTSGETAPIEVYQGFTVTAVHEGTTVEVTGTITATGVEIISWKES